MEIIQLKNQTNTTFSIDVRVLVDLIPFPSVESQTLPKGTVDKVLYRNNDQHFKAIPKYLLMSIGFLTGIKNSDPVSDVLHNGAVTVSSHSIKIWDVGPVHTFSNGFFSKKTRFQARSSFSVRFETNDLSEDGINAVQALTSKYVDAMNARSDLIQMLEELHIQNIREYIAVRERYTSGPGGSPLCKLLVDR